MPDGIFAPARRSRLLTLFLQSVLLTAFLVAIRLPLLRMSQPIDDEVVYVVAGNELAAGGDIYASAVERKPPLLLEVYGAISSLTGPSNALALHLIATLWILATMAAIYATTLRLFDTRAAFLAALSYAVFQQWFYWNNLAFNGEVLMNLPLALGLMGAFSRSRWRRVRFAVSGALAAIAFLLKQPAGIAILPIVMYAADGWPLNRRRDWNVADALSVVGGWILVIAVTGWWLFAHGLLGEAWYWTIGDHDLPHFYWQNAVGKTAAFSLLCAPLLIGSWWSVRDNRLWHGRINERNALVVLTIVSAIGASASWRFYGHYYTALVLPLAILASPALVHAWTNCVLPRTAYAAWFLAIVIGFSLHQLSGLAGIAATTQAGAYLRAASAPVDRIFVWGRGTRIYLDAQRRPASRYIATFPLTGRIFGAPLHIDTTTRILPSAWPNLEKDFAAHPPEFVVDMEVGEHAEYPVGRFPILRNLLQASYAAVARTAEGLVYRRITPASSRQE